MVGLGTKLQNTLQSLPGSVYGYLCIGVGIIGDLLAISLSPQFNLSYMISVLGIGPGGIFFNLGLIFSGFFAFFFYSYLVKVIKTNNNNSIIFRFAKYSFIISCIFYSLVGFFPAIYEYQIIYIIHGVSAGISWLTASIYLCSLGFLFLKSSNFSKFYGYFSFVTAITFIIALLTWNPITEWIMTIAIIAWIIIIASYTLKKKM